MLAHLESIAGTDKPEVFVMPHMADLKPGGRHGLSEGFKRIMRKAGLDLEKVKSAGVRPLSRRTFHAMRHSFASALANAGVAPELRMKLTGHKSASGASWLLPSRNDDAGRRGGEDARPSPGKRREEMTAAVNSVGVQRIAQAGKYLGFVLRRSRLAGPV